MGLGLKLATPKADYDLPRRVGSGTYGQVYKVRHIRTDELPLVKVKPEAGDNIFLIQQELYLLRDAMRPISNALVICDLNHDLLAMVLRYSGLRSLQDIFPMYGQLQMPNLPFVYRQTVMGLDFLHILAEPVHREITIANIFLAHSGKVYLADFAVTPQTTTTNGKRKSVIGTPYRPMIGTRNNAEVATVVRSGAGYRRSTVKTAEYQHLTLFEFLHACLRTGRPSPQHLLTTPHQGENNASAIAKSVKKLAAMNDLPDDIAVTTKKKRRTISGYYYKQMANELAPLPLLSDTKGDELHALLLQKIRQCEMIFDFSDALAAIKGKEVKRKALLELVEFMSAAEGIEYSDEFCDRLTTMIGINIFRYLPPTDPEFDPEVDEPPCDEAWPHLQHVYLLLHRFIEYSPSAIKKHVDNIFLAKLFRLLGTEDPRERKLVQSIIYEMYAKCIWLRATIRKEISNALLSFLHEDVFFSGIAQILEIVQSIIYGYSIPLKKENKEFVVRVVLPLYKSSHWKNYMKELDACVDAIVMKDASLATTIIGIFLRYWPKQSAAKEIKFIRQLERVIVSVNTELLDPCIRQISLQLSRSLTSPHVKVCEAVLSLFGKERFLAIVEHFADEIITSMFPPLFAIVLERAHWNDTILDLIYNLLQLFGEIDSDVFKRCMESYEADRDQENDRRLERLKFWESMEKIENDRLRGMETVATDDTTVAEERQPAEATGSGGYDQAGTTPAFPRQKNTNLEPM